MFTKVISTQPANHPLKSKVEEQHWATQLIRYANSQDWLGKVWSALTGRKEGLLDLTKIQATYPMLDHHFIGRQIVLLNLIRGSASSARCYDFDANFRPLRDHNRNRWQSVDAARRRGAKLPPVALIQVGEIYFVEDGHHRISVARARGEQTIEAVVTVAKVAGPLPWERQAITV
jgi:hypothetical protein